MKFCFVLLNRFICLLFLVLFSMAAICQSGNSGEIIQTKFDQYRNSILQEKIYAHTDKEFYLSGEALWFNLFYVDASLHRPLDVSKLAYVELLNKEHQPALQAKISLSDGCGSGSFMLPTDLPAGVYYFRAYTNWMKNFDADFYFEKNITVVNTLNVESSSVQKNNNDQYDIQFFPEGGNLISDIPTRLGFRAVDASGKGADFTGVILNQSGDTVNNFQPLKFGIGSVDFLPKRGEEYDAVIRVAGGQLIRKKLPVAKEDGYSLRVENDNGQVHIKISGSRYFDNKTVYLFIHARQQTEEWKQGILKNSQAEFVIDEKNLLDGISQITVFSVDKQPVCERLYFKKPVHQLAISGFADKQQYESRRKVQIEIGSKEEEGKNVPAKMSIAVYQSDSTMATNEDILSYLYLNSDLKGSIESPNYYFSNDEAVAKMLDNLMLTHGWRRFKWDDVLQGKKPSITFAPEFEGHIITAKLLNKKTGLAANGVSAYLSVPDTNFQFYAAKTNADGEASFYTKKFYGKREVFSRAAGKQESYRVNINSPFSENYSSRLLSPFSYSNLSGDVLQAKSVSMQVRNIYTAEMLNRYHSVMVPSYSFYKPQARYLLDDYVRFTTMEDVLREYVREIVVNKQNNKLLLSLMRKDGSGLLNKHSPLVLVDGVPLLDDYNKMFDYDPLKVKDLQIVNKRYFLGNAEFDGVVNFKTYKGYPDALPLDSEAVVVDYEGLQLQREFYAPVYETANQIGSKLPDFRNLLYWSPIIKTNENGKYTLSFYTSDLPGKYRVVVQALSDDGRAGTTNFTFDVINPSFADKN